MRKSPRTSVLVSWEDAAALLEDESALMTLLARRKGVDRLNSGTLSRYRNAGVPIQEIGDELLAAWRMARGALVGDVDRSTPSRERAADMPHPLQFLWKLYADRDRNPQPWQAIESVLMLMPDYTPTTAATTEDREGEKKKRRAG